METTGLFSGHGSRKIRVPLKRTSYEIKIVGICAEVSIQQKFVNDGSSSIEAVYVFPKDEGAVITEFSFKTDGRRFHTSIEERNEAFRHYDEAIKKGDGAALLDEITRDLLQISVGNLKPKQAIDFTIKWVQELDVIDDRFRFFLPLTRFPRYQRLEADPVQADIQNAGIAESIPYAMDLTVVWENTLIKKITSQTHAHWDDPRVFESDPKFTSMKLVGGLEAFSHDLEIIGEPQTDTTSVAYLARHENGSSFLFSRFIPKFEATGALKEKEVVFWLDCSGSMEGSPIEHAKMALEVCLRSLSEGDTFSFVLFGSEYQIIRDEGNQPFRYTEENFNRALERIKSTDADMGGTELFHAIEEVLKHAGNNGKPQEWVLLTDGGVSDPEMVLNLVANAKIKPRIFTFGIGSGASSSLLKGLARVTGGSCEMVLNEYGITELVLRHFARIDQPRVEEVQLKLPGVDIDLAEPLPPLFEGDGWHSIARLRNRPESLFETAKLTGVIEGKRADFSAQVIDLGTWNPIGCLWASKKICSLEENELQAGSNQRQRIMAANRKESLRIALEFSIISSQTSFIGIEERLEGDKWIEKPVFAIVPSLIAEDRSSSPISSRQNVLVYKGTLITQLEDDSDVQIFHRKSFQESSSPSSDATQVQSPVMFETQFARRRQDIETPSSDALVVQSPDMFKAELALRRREIEQPWYLQLVGLMSREGLFDFTETIRLLSMNFSNIDAIIQEINAAHGLPKSQDVIATIIAVKALESDHKAEKVCRKAIKKARRALKKGGMKMSLLERIALPLLKQ